MRLQEPGLEADRERRVQERVGGGIMDNMERGTEQGGKGER